MPVEHSSPACQGDRRAVRLPGRRQTSLTRRTCISAPITGRQTPRPPNHLGIERTPVWRLPQDGAAPLMHGQSDKASSSESKPGIEHARRCPLTHFISACAPIEDAATPPHQGGYRLTSARGGGPGQRLATHRRKAESPRLLAQNDVVFRARIFIPCLAARHALDPSIHGCPVAHANRTTVEQTRHRVRLLFRIDVRVDREWPE